MNVTLTQKERMLLEDEKSNEQLCVQKYNKYANQAQDPQLKQLFQSLSSVEQQHLNTVNQILSGQVPGTNQGGQGQQQQPAMQVGQSGGTFNQNDAELCKDMLSTEKFISSTYNTTIFECVDTNVRQALNHIQKEEQEHGEALFNYMQSHGMYNTNA
ncbi:MAG TPA: spore coat protein [Candidatus Deferrimicrobium sp.]|nr:spore coat protein [Candidatus Deferrimicrobium sp.]